MIEKIETCELALEEAGYPWQAVEGDGVTWLLLRRKNNTAPNRISGLDRVVLERFTWDILAREEKRTVYAGSLAVAVRYFGPGAAEEGALTAADEDENLCRELFAGAEPGGRQPRLQTGFEFSEEPPEEETSFPSIVLDAVEEAPHSREIKTGCGTECWRTELVWKAGLSGEGVAAPPRLVKLHLAQLGLYTLLLEAAIRLETMPEQAGAHRGGGEFLAVPRKTTALLLKGEEILEVLGIAQQRGFFAALVDDENRNAAITNLLKTTLVYVSARKGGERLLAASHVCAEESRLPWSSALEFPPSSYSCKMEHLKTMQPDAGRIICETRVWRSANHEYPPTKPKQANTLAAAHSKSALEKMEVNRLDRKKPGDKWRKKTAPYPVDNRKDKLVISIRMRHRQ